MAKVSEAAKAECARMQERYKAYLNSLEKKIIKLESELKTIEDNFQVAQKKIQIAILYIRASSYMSTICYITIKYLDFRSDAQLNESRRYINKAIILLEESLGNHIDDTLSLNEDIHEYLKDKLADEWRYNFICSFGYVIDYLKYCFGENSKWILNFIEIEARFSIIAKNIINFKTYIRDLSPEIKGFQYRLKLMNLVKKLLSDAADEYRKKYELKDRHMDDMRQALNITAALRRIYVYLGESEEANEQKKIYDLWKKKLDSDKKENK